MLTVRVEQADGQGSDLFEMLEIEYWCFGCKGRRGSCSVA